MRNITGIIIHCTATSPNWWSEKSSEEKVEEVRNWHVRDNGWSDIGYHFLIDRDGTVVKGRPIERNGAHVRGHNRGTIGISLFGGRAASKNDNFEDHFTPEQDRALRKLINQLHAEYGDVPVTGHNEYAAKGCPGFQVSSWLKDKPKRTLKKSTTLQSVGLSSAGVVGAVGTAVGSLNDTAQMIVIAGGVVAILGLAWIARERIRKWAAGDH